MDKVRIEIEVERDLVEEADRLGVEIRSEVEPALRRQFSRRAAMTEDAARRWREDNAEAIRQSNEELQRNGLWSDGYRLF